MVHFNILVHPFKCLNTSSRVLYALIVELERAFKNALHSVSACFYHECLFSKSIK